MPKPSERRVVMVKNVARRWIESRSQSEYRLEVLSGGPEIKHLPNLLRSLRDGKVAMEGVRPIPDLGVKEAFDSLSLWSANREGLMSLQAWFEKRGFETTGIW